MVVKVLTLHRASSDTTSVGKGCLVNLTVGVEVQIPHLASTDTAVGMWPHYHLAVMKVSAPYLTFSDTNSAEGLGCSVTAGEGGSLGFPFGLC